MRQLVPDDQALFKAMLTKLRAAEASRDFVLSYLTEKYRLSQINTITDDGVIIAKGEPIPVMIPLESDHADLSAALIGPPNGKEKNSDTR